VTTYRRHIINLELRDYWTIQRVARERGLGDKSLSPALSLIIREWEYYRKILTEVIPITEAEVDDVLTAPE